VLLRKWLSLDVIFLELTKHSKNINPKQCQDSCLAPSKDGNEDHKPVFLREETRNSLTYIEEKFRYSLDI